MLQNADSTIHLLSNTGEKSVPNLLKHMSSWHYKLQSKLSSIVGFAFKVGNKTSIRLSIIVQDTGRRKQKGGLALVIKCHLKKLLFIYRELLF